MVFAPKAQKSEAEVKAASRAGASRGFREGHLPPTSNQLP